MSEELDAIDDELIAAIAKVKGQDVHKAEPRPMAEIYPVSAAAETAAMASWLEAEKEALENPQPGQKMPDGTIYVGRYNPKDREGRSLNREFNVFAAKEDLPGSPRTYLDTVAHIASLKDWNGYAGASYASDEEFYTAIRDGTYKGEWIVPTRDILKGKDVNDNSTMHHNLFTHRNTGAFRNTFTTVESKGDGLPFWYWSSTELRGFEEFVHVIKFSDNGNDTGDFRNRNHMSCRPVRLVPCK